MNRLKKVSTADHSPTLSYARPGTVNRLTPISMAGAFSFIAIIFQCVWFVGMKFNAISRPHKIESDNGVVNWLILFWPLLLAFPLSIYSLRFAGTTLRNVGGVTGFVVSTTIILLSVLKVCI